LKRLLGPTAVKCSIPADPTGECGSAPPTGFDETAKSGCGMITFLGKPATCYQYTRGGQTCIVFVVQKDWFVEEVENNYSHDANGHAITFFVSPGSDDVAIAVADDVAAFRTLGNVL